MEYKSKENAKYIYHYTSMEILIEHILPSFKLKMNTLNKTNDPREMKLSRFHAINNINYVVEYLEISNEIEQLLNNEFYISCFSTDYSVNDQTNKGNTLPRMWATYGKNHKGVCIVINREKFKIENRIDGIDCFLKNVKYKNTASNFFDKNIDELDLSYREMAIKIIHNNIDKLFFTKLFDWHTENEVRFLKRNQKYCSISESIEGIVYGLEFNSYYRPSINTLLKRLGRDINTYKLKFNHSTGDLHIDV